MTKRIIMLILLFMVLIPQARAERPLIVTSISPLAEIIKEAFGESVEVVYLIPPGADPHQAQLTTGQMKQIKEATIIVTSGGHLPVEQNIMKLKKAGDIKARVLWIDDYQREGFSYLERRWMEGKNEHGIWLDPRNGLAIAKALKKVLIEQDPLNAEVYEKKFQIFEERIITIMNSYRVLIGKLNKNVTAIVEMPSMQYAVEWLGVRAIEAIKPEEEYPAKSIDELMTLSGSFDIIVYSTNSPEQLKIAAENLAKRSGRPLANIQVLWTNKEYSRVLIENSAEILKALEVKEAQNAVVKEKSNTIYAILALLLGIAMGLTGGMLLWRW